MFFDLINGDCLNVLKRFESKTIDVVVTSPPYFNLRDYGVNGQIGTEETVEEYIDNLILIFNEVHRVLKDEGSCWVNIDDVYYKQSLLCVPDRFKLRMVENDWICRNEIIWHKPNAMPSSAKSRFNNDYEKFYFFTKKKKYYFQTQYEPLKSVVSKNATKNKKSVGTKYINVNQEASVRQGMTKRRGEKLVFVRKNLPTQKEFVEFIRKRTSVNTIVENSNLSRSKVEHWFRKDYSGFSFPSVEDWNAVKWLIDDFSNEFALIDEKLNDVSIETDDILKNVENGRIKRAIWSINTKPFKGYHFAAFPEELVKTPILACCPENGIVLDPFAGSGTTGLCALKHNRNFIGIDLNESYVDIARKRLKEVTT